MSVTTHRQLRRDRAARPRTALHAQPPAERLDPVAQVGEPLPPAVRGPAAAVVAHEDGEPPVRRRQLHGRRARVRVLDDVGQRLADHVVGRGLDVGREPPLAQLRIGPRRHRHRHPVGPRLDRLHQPAVGEHRRVDAVRQLPQVGHQVRGVGLDGRQLRGHVLAPAHRVAGQADLRQ